MTKDDKIKKQKKYAKRQTILLTVIGILLSAAIITTAIILLTSGSKKISQDTLDSIPALTSAVSDGTEASQTAKTEGTDLKEISFKSENIKLKVGEKASPEIAGGKISDLENWNSNDSAVVTVSQKGELTGVSVGTTEITASVKDGYSLLKLTVKVIEDESEPVKNDDTDMEGAVETGTTSKGYKIYEKDGCTYIYGILMASKTFTLPEDYAPGWEDVAEEAFDKLSSDAAKEGLDIYASSTFRSYEDQDRIYNNYVARDGQEAADTYSSRPGHSDHQTGLAIDVNSIDDSFGYTPESDWLAAHAHEYGFIIRYPEGKAEYTGYQYEPWHIRYIGVDKATEVYESDLSLEEFLGVDSKYDE